MFGLLEGLAKAVVGVVIETPLGLVADVATMGGLLTDREQTYTGEALRKAMENLSSATEE